MAELQEQNAQRLVSRAEYARRRGVSHTAVNKAVAKGKIPLAPGTDLIDPEVADLAWQRNRDQSRPSAIAAGFDLAPVATVPDTSDSIPVQGMSPVEGSRAKADLRTAEAKALMAEVAAAKVKGEVVEVADVRQALSELVMRAKVRLSGIGAKVGLRFGLAAQRLVEDEIYVALEELSDFQPQVEV